MDANSAIPWLLFVDRSNPAVPSDAGFIFLRVGKNILMRL
jgi:hypothetical protein